MSAYEHRQEAQKPLSPLQQAIDTLCQQAAADASSFFTDSLRQEQLEAATMTGREDLPAVQQRVRELMPSTLAHFEQRLTHLGVSALVARPSDADTSSASPATTAPTASTALVDKWRNEVSALVDRYVLLLAKRHAWQNEAVSQSIELQRMYKDAVVELLKETESGSMFHDDHQRVYELSQGQWLRSRIKCERRNGDTLFTEWKDEAETKASLGPQTVRWSTKSGFAKGLEIGGAFVATAALAVVTGGAGAAVGGTALAASIGTTAATYTAAAAAGAVAAAGAAANGGFQTSFTLPTASGVRDSQPLDLAPPAPTPIASGRSPTAMSDDVFPVVHPVRLSASAWIGGPGGYRSSVYVELGRPEAHSGLAPGAYPQPSGAASPGGIQGGSSPASLSPTPSASSPASPLLSPNPLVSNTHQPSPALNSGQPSSHGRQQPATLQRPLPVEVSAGMGSMTARWSPVGLPTSRTIVSLADLIAHPPVIVSRDGAGDARHASLAGQKAHSLDLPLAIDGLFMSSLDLPLAIDGLFMSPLQPQSAQATTDAFTLEPLAEWYESQHMGVRLAAVPALIANGVGFAVSAPMTAVTAETGVGAVVFGVVAAHTADALLASLQTILTGEEHDTVFHRAIRQIDPSIDNIDLMVVDSMVTLAAPATEVARLSFVTLGRTRSLKNFADSLRFTLANEVGAVGQDISGLVANAERARGGGGHGEGTGSTAFLGSFPRWKPGQPVDQITPRGEYPSWNRVRTRTWRNHLQLYEHGDAEQRLMIKRSSQFEWSSDNILRMRRGAAPLDYDGNSLELAHVKSQSNGGRHGPLNVLMMTRQQHADTDTHRSLPGQRKGVDNPTKAGITLFFPNNRP